MESQHCSDTPGAVSSMGHPKGFGKSFSHVPAQGQPFSNSLARLFSSRGHFALPTCETCPGVHSPPRAFLPKLFPDPFYCTMGRHPFPAQRGSGDNQCMGYKSLRSPGTSSETPWVRPQQAPLAGWSCVVLAGARILRPVHIRLPLQTPGTPCPAALPPAPTGTAAPPLWFTVDFPLLGSVRAFPPPALNPPPPPSLPFHTPLPPPSNSASFSFST